VTSLQICDRLVAGRPTALSERSESLEPPPRDGQIERRCELRICHLKNDLRDGLFKAWFIPNILTRLERVGPILDLRSADGIPEEFLDEPSHICAREHYKLLVAVPREISHCGDRG
jgi:hypothetical protein